MPKTPALLRRFPAVLPFLLLPGLGAAPSDSGADWPAFRGPGQDGISPETGIGKEWPRGGLPVVWRIQLGSGFSAFAAVGDRLYTLAEHAGRQEALCLDEADRKSTRLNSSHGYISYAVFCLKKKNI